jgi:hypothetical protein
MSVAGWSGSVVAWQQELDTLKQRLATVSKSGFDGSMWICF